MPFWHGDMFGRQLETGRAVGKFVREMGGRNQDSAEAILRDEYGLDQFASRNLIGYIQEEKAATGVLPTDQTIVVERFRDEIGDWRVVLLSPLGARIHAPWGMALRHRFRNRYGTDVDVIWSDDGIAFRFPDSDDPPEADDLILDPEEVEALLVDHIADTALFAARFRGGRRTSVTPPTPPPRRAHASVASRDASLLISSAWRSNSGPFRYSSRSTARFSRTTSTSPPSWRFLVTFDRGNSG